MFSFVSFFRFFGCAFLLIGFHLCQADVAAETVYLTWKKDPTSTMTVQWVSTSEQKQTTLIYTLKGPQANWQKIMGDEVPFPHASSYLIHSVEMTQLQPNTEYLFRVEPYEKIYQFKTAPVHLDPEICSVVGGDMYHDGIDFMIKTCQAAAKSRPLFALIGGDIAYAVPTERSRLQKIDRWIDWLRAWSQTMVTDEGNSIPVVAAIGNHDLLGGYNQTPKEARIFSTLFPMPGPQIYNVLNFDSYLRVFILDSGHASRIGGEQTNWLKNNLKTKRETMHQFAIYHVPAYPSIRGYKNTRSAAIRRHWLPLFEKMGIQTVFEQHDHAYKRTYPLLKNKIHPNGIVFIGDGAWGVEYPRRPSKKNKRFYMAKFVSARHFIEVTLTPNKQKIKSITDEGKIIDEYVKELK